MSDEEQQATIAPVVTWLPDTRKDDPYYRCTIDGREYIRSLRKPKKPRVQRPRKPIIITPEERVRRKAYMRVYRKKRTAEIARLRVVEAAQHAKSQHVALQRPRVATQNV